MVRRGIWVLLVAMLLSAGCSGAAAPSASPPPSASGGLVTTEAEAAAAVVAHEPRFEGILPRDADMVGQSSWYEVAPASGVGAFLVAITVGWGDCPAGCIDEHTWLYAVLPDGTVTLQRESGDAVPPDAWPAPKTGIVVSAIAGPTCPVETVPPDPGCAPRPVAAAMIDVRDATGGSVARGTTDLAGSAFLEVPPGAYRVSIEDPGDGYMTAPDAQDVEVGAGAVAMVTFVFDTGIR
jgi:hypothetical protein